MRGVRELRPFSDRIDSYTYLTIRDTGVGIMDYGSHGWP